VIVLQMGGAVGRVPTIATAFPQRDAVWLGWVIGVCDSPETDETNIA